MDERHSQRMEEINLSSLSLNSSATSFNNSRGRFTFFMQIGLMREPIYLETELSMAALNDLACSFVDRKVCNFSIVLKMNV